MNTDVLVIGTGISGLSYAIKLSMLSPKIKITLICKEDLMEGNTRYAQGGIAAVYNFEKDSFEKHIEDTYTAGDHQGDLNVIDFVVKEGTERVNELMEWGAAFDTKKTKEIDLAQEGGHSEKRILHHKDHSGSEIQRALIDKIKDIENIRYLENHILVDLITDHHTKTTHKRCYGAYIISTIDRQVITIASKLTVLTTGGVGQLYEFTTNPRVATGDGLGVAYRAKVKIKNLPYIQFHPTALHPKVNGETFLITEALRGSGGILKNLSGERFMHRYDKREELAPRDIVSRAISEELLSRKESHVLLDATQIDEEVFSSHFPMIKKTCRSIGIDPLNEGIPVIPAAHYSCGGIEVDPNGESSLQGLFAVGECSHTGLHGANRLASNSLLEAIVYAHRAAVYSVECIQSIKLSDTFYSNIPNWDGQEYSSDLKLNKTQKLFTKLQQLMSSNAGIFKTNKGLKEASKELNSLYTETLDLYQKNKLTPQLCELRNMVSVAYLLINQALQIKENKGVFYNNDYAKKSIPKAVQS